jgi:hypothetical protein
MALPLFESSNYHPLDLPQCPVADFVCLRITLAGPIFAHRLSTAIRNLIAFFSYRVS